MNTGNPYVALLRTAIESPTFQRQADDFWSEDERLDFLSWLAANPEVGDVIPGADGARKVRWTLPGIGKRGGARVIYFNYAEDGTVILVMMYAKGDRENVNSGDIKRALGMDIEKIAKAIEADAREALPQLRQALQEVQDIRAGRAVGRVTTPEQLLVRAARAKLGLSQAEFAARIGTPVATLRDWEQGRFSPPGAAMCLLRLLVAHPSLSDELVAA